MTPRRRRRWLIALAMREASRVYWSHREFFALLTWPLRDPHTWWYCRRINRALRAGRWVIQA